LLMQPRDTPLGPPPKREERPHPLTRLAERWEGDRFDLERRAPRLAHVDVPAVDVAVPERRLTRRVVRHRDRTAQAFSSTQVLLWLTFKQAWIPLGIFAAVGFLAGFLMPAYGQVLWPVATLLLGVACGTAAFGQEQSDLSY